MKVDFKDAFPSVSSKLVFSCFRYHFYWYVSRALTDICTYEDFLPQGAPTSPRIFDQVCYRFDAKMQNLVKNYKAIYTRFADNIFVSVESDKFSNSLRNAVLKNIERCGFAWHDLRVCRTLNSTVRGLGLNIIDGKLYNTRAWKKQFRKTLHHMQYLMDNNFDHEKDWERLEGMRQFVCEETISPVLLDCYDKLSQQIDKERRPWLFINV